MRIEHHYVLVIVEEWKKRDTAQNGLVFFALVEEG